MELSILREVAAWEAVSEEWDALLARSIQDVPFLRFAFLRSWWETLGGGEWPEGDLSVVVARRSGGDLVAAAPLFRTPGAPETARLIGTSEIADFLDVLCEPPALDEFSGALLETLSGERVASIDLWNLLEDSPSQAALARAAQRGGWRPARQRLKPCPRVSLEGGWEDYLARLDKKQRHELRRKMRRAEAAPGGIAFPRAGRDRELDPAVDSFLDLMRHDPAKAGFLSEPMRRTFQALARSAAEEGWLRLEFLEVGGEVAAGVFAFDYDGQLWLYNSGLNPAHQELSPGWVLLGHMIRSAAAEGRRAFDFLRGGEDYKFRLGGVARNIERLTLRRL
jgi:CelD/BcsL family acetyltransferase involved in cellulose biosynthesis